MDVKDEVLLLGISEHWLEKWKLEILFFFFEIIDKVEE